MQVPGSFEKGETGGPVSPEAADARKRQVQASIEDALRNEMKEALKNREKGGVATDTTTGQNIKR